MQDKSIFSAKQQQQQQQKQINLVYNVCTKFTKKQKHKNTK
jgi:hypothetical protein